MKGTQTHLDFIPERTTDFILAVYAEEFGFVGIVLLLCLYCALIFRGLIIAANAPSYFRAAPRRVDHAGLLHVCVRQHGDGLWQSCRWSACRCRFMSYGGTALVTLGIGAGILMSVQRHKKLVQT